MKEYLVGNLAKDWGRLIGLRNVSFHVGCASWDGRGPRPSPRWKSASRDLVGTVVQGAAICTVSFGLPAWT